MVFNGDPTSLPPEPWSIFCYLFGEVLSQHVLFHLLYGFCVTTVRTFDNPLPSLYWWAVSVGGEEFKWSQLAHHQLMSQPRIMPAQYS